MAWFHAKWQNFRVKLIRFKCISLRFIIFFYYYFVEFSVKPDIREFPPSLIISIYLLLAI